LGFAGRFGVGLHDHFIKSKNKIGTNLFLAFGLGDAFGFGVAFFGLDHRAFVGTDADAERLFGPRHFAFGAEEMIGFFLKTSEFTFAHGCKASKEGKKGWVLRKRRGKI
jgi:hypothetical protein